MKKNTSKKYSKIKHRILNNYWKALIYELKKSDIQPGESLNILTNTHIYITEENIKEIEELIKCKLD